MAIPSISNNTPSVGHISWGAFTIQLNGVAYSVGAASTNQRWVWWKYNGGSPIIQAGPDIPTTLVDDDLLLFGNKNGIGVRIQSTNFIDGELLVDGSILADAIGANQIVTEHMQVGSIDGDRITAGTLESDRVIVGAGDPTLLEDFLKEYVQSRGMNLVANGTGLLGDNTNFSLFTFNPTNRPEGSGGSFQTPMGSTATRNTDEWLPVDPTKHYTFSLMAKQLAAGVSSWFYSGFIMGDIDKQSIQPYHYMRVQGAVLTTLSAPLNPGATTITLADATGWYEGATAHQRTIGFFDYADSKGFVYPSGTYTRNVIFDTNNGAWAANGINGNIITLAQPYSGPARPAGTPVGNMMSGGTYVYVGGGNSLAPAEWTPFTEEFGGLVTGGLSAGSAPKGFPPGTAFARIMVLPNRSDGSATAVPTSQMAFANISLSEIAEGNLDGIREAYERWAPNGVTTIDGGKITADSLTTQQIKARTITALDIATGAITANEIAAGTITANEIGAGAVTADEIAAGAVTADEIAAGAIVAEKIAAGSVVSDKIAAGAVTAEKITADAITSTHLEGKFISGVTLDIEGALHAEPGYLDIEANLVEAQSAIFHNNVTRRGTNNFLEGRETASAGVSDPGTPPTITSVWPFVQLTSATGTPRLFPVENSRGTYFNSSASELVVLTQNLQFEVYNSVTGASKRIVGTSEFLVQTLGFARQGDWYYVAVQPFMDLRLKIWRYSALSANEGVRDATWEIDALDMNTLGNEQAVNLIGLNNAPEKLGLVWVAASDGKYRFRAYNIAAKTISDPTATLPGVAPGASTTIAGAEGSEFVGFDLRIQPGGKDLAAFSEFGDVWSVTSLSQRKRPYDEILVGSSGARTLDTKGRLFTHSTWSESAPAYNYTYTWYDSDSDGLGVAESKASPARNFTIAKGAYVNIKTPLPNDDGTSDAPNTVRFYANDKRQSNEFSTQELVTGRTLSSLLDSGTASPINSGFASRPQTLPGGYQSTGGDVDGPFWWIRGDGDFRLGDLRRDGATGRFKFPAGSSLIAPSGSYSGPGATFFRIGNWVFIDITVARASGTGTGYVATGVVAPVDYRPVATAVFEAYPFFTTTARYQFRILTTGEVEVRMSAADSSNMQLVSMYRVA